MHFACVRGQRFIEWRCLWFGRPERNAGIRRGVAHALAWNELFVYRARCSTYKKTMLNVWIVHHFFMYCCFINTVLCFCCVLFSEDRRDELLCYRGLVANKVAFARHNPDVVLSNGPDIWNFDLWLQTFALVDGYRWIVSCEFMCLTWNIFWNSILLRLDCVGPLL